MKRLGKVLIAFLDVSLTLNALLVILLALVLTKYTEDVQKQKGNIIDPAQFIIEMDWEEGSPNDMDLWVGGPTGAIVMYQQKDIGMMTLDRDDLGTTNNVIKMSDGTYIANRTRREVVSIRALIPGKYTVNGILYSKRSDPGSKVKVTVRRLNPYVEIYQGEIDFKGVREEQTFVSFEIDAEGKVIWLDKTAKVSLFSRIQLK